MAEVVRQRIAAIEEHYLDPEVREYFGIPDNVLTRKMQDFASIRLDEMDEANIDVQVLSHVPPGFQQLNSTAAPEMARRVNDRLYQVIQSHPDRFSGFASLPTMNPIAAAAELERAVSKLHFKGAMIHGLTGNKFIDEKEFWPIFEVAQALDVPIYIHPADPHPAVLEAYFGTYAKSHPMFTRAAWGFTFETGTQAVRLVLSGVLDAYPNLKIILGHLGEAIPFLLARIDEALARDTPMKNFRSYFSRNFYITTSGFFSDPALLCCIQELGVDRIIFSVDWPFASNAAGTAWMKRVSLCEEDKHKIFYSNAQRLLKLP